MPVNSGCDSNCRCCPEVDETLTIVHKVITNGTENSATPPINPQPSWDPPWPVSLSQNPKKVRKGPKKGLTRFHRKQIDQGIKFLGISPQGAPVNVGKG